MSTSTISDRVGVFSIQPSPDKITNCCPALPPLWLADEWIVVLTSLLPIWSHQNDRRHKLEMWKLGLCFGSESGNWLLP
ncbi:hypothetical protein E5D57_006530 [Metarhizium anisopliae]|nr:hypothetical protein E5D57_006530 [Metarhizium anisopliae]